MTLNPLELLDKISSPATSWPKLIRRIYVCTWPFSFIFRWASFLVLMLMVIPFMFLMMIYERLKDIWNGNSNGWDG